MASRYGRPQNLCAARAAHGDHAQRGLGTASCGPDTAERYKLLESRYSFGYVLAPIASRQENAGS